jgi:serine/threonine-protein kinase
VEAVETHDELPTHQRPPLPGRIGRYRIACELGQGGMAVLYLGTSMGPGGFERFFAIKMIHEHLCREQPFVSMFLGEARIAARLQHPNVIPVYEVDVDRGRYYLAMDYVSGETLAQTITEAWWEQKRDGFPYPMAAAIVSESCEGLHAAHEVRDPEGQLVGVVHRDVAPRNIMVGYDGIVRLMDFGVAKIPDQLNATRPGLIKGTLPYMAPEYLLGESLDRRADVFSMGVVVWELTIGKRLFKAQNEVETGARILGMTVPRPTLLRADYPPELEAIVMKALDRDRNKRFDSAREMGDALRDFNHARRASVSTRDIERFMKELFRERHPRRMEMERRAANNDPDAALSLDPEGPPGIGGADKHDSIPSIEIDRALVAPKPRGHTDPGGDVLRSLLDNKSFGGITRSNVVAVRQQHRAWLVVPIAALLAILGLFALRGGTKESDQQAVVIELEQPPEVEVPPTPPPPPPTEAAQERRAPTVEAKEAVKPTEPAQRPQRAHVRRTIKRAQKRETAPKIEPADKGDPILIHGKEL